MDDMTFELIRSSQGAKIKVVGLGGAGGNAVNNMIESGLSGVEFIVVNTDAQDLEKSMAQTRIQIGCQATRGLGTGANPDLGSKAAEENLDAVRASLEGADMVFLAAGLGGGTGTGAGPVVADVAKEYGCLTVGVVTKPFFFEGTRRMKIAEAGFKELRSRVDTIITIPNDKLLDTAPKNAPAQGTFKRADDVLFQAVRGIADLITTTGDINVDFNDVRSVMSEKGQALMGAGTASGDNRGSEAAMRAITNPLLEDISIAGAKGLLINITSGPDLTISEMKEAAHLVQKEADPDANIFVGMVIDESMSEELTVTVIATGIGEVVEEIQRPDMSIIRNEAMVELGKRDLETPAFRRETQQSWGEHQANRSINIDVNDTEIPTFLRRMAD